MLGLMGAYGWLNGNVRSVNVREGGWVGKC